MTGSKKEIQEPSYYAIITANVRYDDRVVMGAKLLFAEITALSNKYGFCWSSNAYFAKLYKKKPRTISRWVGQLVSAGHITTIVDEQNANLRRMYLTIPLSKAIDKNDHRGIDEIIQGGIDKKVHHNNTRVNNTRGEGKPTQKSYEVIAKESFIVAKGDQTDLRDEFIEWFSVEIIARWDKYAVTEAVLRDWYKLWRSTGEVYLQPAIETDRVRSESWKPSFSGITKHAKKLKKTRDDQIQYFRRSDDAKTAMEQAIPRATMREVYAEMSDEDLLTEYEKNSFIKQTIHQNAGKRIAQLLRDRKKAEIAI